MFLSEDFEAILSIFASGDVSYEIGKVISYTSSGIVAWFWSLKMGYFVEFTGCFENCEVTWVISHTLSGIVTQGDHFKSWIFLSVWMLLWELWGYMPYSEWNSGSGWSLLLTFPGRGLQCLGQVTTEMKVKEKEVRMIFFTIWQFPFHPDCWFLQISLVYRIRIKQLFTYWSLEFLKQKGLHRKAWTRTKILSPNIYFCNIIKICRRLRTF